MVWNKILLFTILCVSCSVVWSQENFIKACESKDERIHNDVLFYSSIVKSNDCKKIAEHISLQKSFNQVLIPSRQKFSQVHVSWMLEFPEFIGWKPVTDTHQLYMDYSYYFKPTSMFEHPEMYSEFKNLTSIEFSESYRYENNICSILRTLPQIKTLLISQFNLDDLEKCEPEINIPKIIIVDFYSVTHVSIPKYADKIIGIEGYQGPSDMLPYFRKLKYLAANVHTTFEPGDLIANLNLTHVSLNFSEARTNLAKLSKIENLEWLSITCIPNWMNVSFGKEKVKVCNGVNIGNLEFIHEMEYLETLVLPFNNLEDASTLADSRTLVKLDISNNNLKNIPDLSHIKFINIQNNPATVKK